MSDFNDSGAYRDATPHNSIYPDSSQGRPVSGYPPSSGGRKAPRYSRATNASWVSNGNGMLSPPLHQGPPSTAGSRPLPVPSPPPSRGVSEFRPQYASPSDMGYGPESYRGQGHEPEEWEPETERMTIGPSEDEEYHSAPHPTSQLHGLPEYAQHGPEQRQDSFYDPMAPAEPEPKPEPKRKTTFVGGFIAGLRKLPKAMVKSTLYDRKATRKGAPGTELETGPSHYLPAYDDPGVTVADPSSVHYVEAVGVPTSPVSPSQRSYADGSRPTSNSRSQRYSAMSVPHSLRPTSPRIVTTPQPMSPVLVNPAPASDYAKMDSPVRIAPPDDSFSAHVSRVKEFFYEFKNLPWTSSRVALDYIPTESRRARLGKAKQSGSGSGSWYTGVGPHQDIDLLGSGRLAPRQLREDGGASVRSAGARIAIAHDGRTPASFVTSPALMPSPGMSSHGQGQHPMSYSYYFAPPQPLYVYQSPMTTPATNPALMESPAPQPPPSPGQAVPVYMMAGPPPGLIPTPPPAALTPGHGQAIRASPNPLPPGLPVSQVPSHHSHANSATQ